MSQPPPPEPTRVDPLNTENTTPPVADPDAKAHNAESASADASVWMDPYPDKTDPPMWGAFPDDHDESGTPAQTASVDEQAATLAEDSSGASPAVETPTIEYPTDAEATVEQTAAPVEQTEALSWTNPLTAEDVIVPPPPAELDAVEAAPEAPSPWANPLAVADSVGATGLSTDPLTTPFGDGDWGVATSEPTQPSFTQPGPYEAPSDPYAQPGMYGSPQPDPFGSPQTDPYNTPQPDPYSTPQPGAYGPTPYQDPGSSPQPLNPYSTAPGPYDTAAAAPAWQTPAAPQQYQTYQPPSYPPQPAAYPLPVVYSPAYPQLAFTPNGVDPRTGLPFSSKSKVAAGLLQLFLGGLGIGRFYTGHIGIAIGQVLLTLFTGGIGGLWGFIDGIVILAGDPRDSNGLPLS